MSPFDGDRGEMPVPPLDDRALEALLNGAHPGQSGLDWLLPFVEDLDRAAQEPAPVVRPALAVLLRDGFTPADTSPAQAPAPAPVLPSPTPARPRPALRAALLRVAGLSVLAKAGLGASVALAGTTAAGAAGVLPDPAQRAIAAVVAASTPFTFPDTTDKSSRGPVVSAPPAGVAGDTGPPSSLPPSSRGAAGSPADNGVGANPGVTGLDRANQTPAAGHVPTSVPGGGRPEGPGSTPGNGQGPSATTPAVTAPAITAPGITAPKPTPPVSPGPPSTVSPGSAGRDTAVTTPAATRPSQP
jgi:hypothetical protein